jgi:pilus assembly protein CpaB
MWKVKRMNTARIVVLTIAVGAGGIAAYLASGSYDKPFPTEPVAQLQTVDVLVGALALRSIVDPNAVETRSGDQAPRRSEGIDVARHGVSNPTTT